MTQTIGVLMILVGLVFGAWVGVWWAFIGGIVDVIQSAKAQNVDAFQIATGIAKVFLAGPIGVFAALCLVVPGSAMADSR